MIHYVGVQEGEIDQKMSVEEFKELGVHAKFPIRNTLYETPKYIDQFVRENPYRLSQEDLQIAQGFKNFKQGQFWIFRYLKKHTIFLDDDFAYGVLALSDYFQDFFGDNLPQLVNAVLLPFKGRIVYDGMMRSGNMFFGSGIKASLRNTYNLAKAKYGIITQLPIDEKLLQDSASDEATLTALMKSKTSVDHNWYEIEELLDRNPGLANLYDQLSGKLQVRDKRKELKTLGIKNYHFAISMNSIVASGKTLKEVQERVKQMVPVERREAIHYFKV
ncbi:MAG: hypothetical protein AAF798_05490 [Bacteroidota bacterium]